MLVTVLFYLTVFIYGIIIGSFLNVCIYRLPLQENIVTTRSHCMKCGYQLRWYDLVPLFSYMLLGGRCRKCKEKISVQYPLIEALNGFFYVLVVAVCGVSIEALLYCLLCSALIVLSVIDFRTYEIPVGINYFIAVLGVARIATDCANWLQYLIGMICVSVFLLLLYWMTKGRGIGGGDIKLMAASGLLLGWQLNILAFVLGCILGSVIHLIRMRFSEEGNVLALGPYLAAGIAISALWGTDLIGWYLTLYAF